MIKKTLKDFFTKPISVIVIPDSTKKVQQFKLIKAFIVIPVLIFICYFCYTIYENQKLQTLNADLNEVLTIKSDSIHSLNLVIKRQSSEIDELENATNIVKAKLTQLQELEIQVRSMVGLKDNPDTESALEASMATEAFDSTTESLVGILSEQYSQYNDFVESLEKQLDYLDAKPDLWPVNGRITSKFGYRMHPISKKKQFHKGIDIANKMNTDIKVAGSGIVTFAGWNGGYGNVLKVYHGYGYHSVYAHNNKLLVKVGDRVNKGDVIAKLGNSGKSTGPHVHFEVHYQNQQINPLGILKEKE